MHKNLVLAKQLVGLAEKLVSAATPYFKTQAEALRFALEDAAKRGAVVDEDDFWGFWNTTSVGYEKSAQHATPVTGKKFKMLKVELYRMPSGNYELNHYLT